MKLESDLSAIFLPRLRNSWSMATAPLEIPRLAGFKPHRLIGQEIAHSKARRQADNIYIKDKDGTEKFIAGLGKAIKIKKKTENRLC